MARTAVASALLLSTLALAACGAGDRTDSGVRGATKTLAAPRDWTRFGWDARRSSSFPYVVVTKNASCVAPSIVAPWR